MPAEADSDDGDDDDASLLAAARRGDAGAFGALVMRHQSRVRRQLRHLVRGSDAVADELAQDAFALVGALVAALASSQGSLPGTGPRAILIPGLALLVVSSIMAWLAISRS